MKLPPELRRELVRVMKAKREQWLAQGREEGRREILAGFATVARLNGSGLDVVKAFDEAKHKRDHGKFATTGGSDGTDEDVHGGGVRANQPDPSTAGNDVPGDSAEEAPHTAKLLDLTDDTPPSLLRRVGNFIGNKYKVLADKYGHKGAVTILVATVAMVPIPLPGTVMIPVALANAVQRLKHKLVGVSKAEMDPETVQTEARALLEALYTEMGEPVPDADRLPGGKADHTPDSAFPRAAVQEGTAHEAEHTTDPALAKEIAKDHIAEDPAYYDKLATVEGDGDGDPHDALLEAMLQVREEMDGDPHLPAALEWLRGQIPGEGDDIIGKAFDEGEARDESGKWTAGGGSSAPAPTNSPPKMARDTPNSFSGTFAHGGVDYSVHAHRDSESVDEMGDRAPWDVEFISKAGDAAAKDHGKTGAAGHSAIGAMRSMGHAISDWMATEKPIRVKFLADASDPTRVKLYERLANALAEKHGYTVSRNDGGNVRFMLTRNAAETVEKAWESSKHPRSKTGQFISKDRMDAAKSDPKVAAQLRAEVKPEDAHKLEAVLEGKESPGRTKRGEAKHAAGQRRETREASKARANELIHRLHAGIHEGGVTADDLHALADHLPQMTRDDVRRARMALTVNRLAAGYGGASRKAEMVAHLVTQARQHAAAMQGAGEAGEAVADPLSKPYRDETRVPEAPAVAGGKPTLRVNGRGRPASAHDLGSGVRLLAPDDLDTARQHLAPDDVRRALAEVPEPYRALVREVHLRDEYEPGALRAFGSHDPSGGGVVELHRNDQHTPEFARKQVGRTVRHEAAHALAEKLGPDFVRDWEAAAAEDGGHITPYAATDAHEDIAETMMHYWSPDPDERRVVREFFPARASVLAKYGVAAGKPVPEAVLRDYPDLTPKPPTSPDPAPNADPLASETAPPAKPRAGAAKVGKPKVAPKTKPAAAAATTTTTTPTTPSVKPKETKTPAPQESRPPAANVPQGHAVVADHGHGVVTARDPNTGRLVTHFPPGMPEREADRLHDTIAQQAALWVNIGRGASPVANVVQDVAKRTGSTIGQVMAALHAMREAGAIGWSNQVEGTVMRDIIAGKQQEVAMARAKGPEDAFLWDEKGPAAYLMLPQDARNAQQVTAKYLGKRKPPPPAAAPTS